MVISLRPAWRCSAGITRWSGTIVGTIVFFVLQQELANYGAWYLILLGSVAVIVAIFFRGGIWGVVERRFGLQLFPVQRRVRLPAQPAARQGEASRPN